MLNGCTFTVNSLAVSWIIITFAPSLVLSRDRGDLQALLQTCESRMGKKLTPTPFTFRDDNKIPWGLLTQGNTFINLIN